MYTSTIDIVIGHDEIVNGDESTPPPNRHLFPGYNETKRKAEEMVIAANGRSLADGTLELLWRRFLVILVIHVGTHTIMI